jgi:4-hydroxy-tetrahydrodipicolinate synthase
MLRLAGHPNIIGVKEASGSMPQVMDLISKKPADFWVLSGDDNLCLPIIMLGGTGIISVASNIIPSEMEELVKQAVSGEVDKARALHYRLLPLFQALFIDTNPVPVKYAMHKMGILEESYRLPMCPMDNDKKAQLERVLKSLSIL